VGRVPACASRIREENQTVLFSQSKTTAPPIHLAIGRRSPLIQQSLYSRNIRSVTPCTVPSSSDEIIRNLCAKAVATHNPDEVEDILAQLRVALQQRIQQIRLMAAQRNSRFADTGSESVD
jgi:hypothetical protein